MVVVKEGGSKDVAEGTCLLDLYTSLWKFPLDPSTLNLHLTFMTQSNYTSGIGLGTSDSQIRREAGPTSLNKSRGSLKPHIRRKENCDRFILVNTGTLRVPEIWDELKACLNPEMFKGIVSLKKVHPKNRPARIDMYVDAAVAAGLKRTIKSMSELRTPKFVRVTKTYISPDVKWRSRAISLWRVDLWKDWRDRPERPNQTNIDCIPRRNHIMTLNVNGLASKQLDVANLLLNEQISICALQETLVSERAYRVRFEGYTAYTQNWKDGFRGQTLLVRNHLSSYEVEREDHLYIYIKVSGLPGVGKPVHVIALYLPSGGNFKRERRKLIRKVHELNRSILKDSPGAPIIILGDWNMDREEVQKNLVPEITGLQILRAKGSPLSRFPTNAPARAIDHMVVSAGMINILRNPRIFRNYGISDHRPLIAAFRAVTISEPPPVERWTYNTEAIKRYGRELVYDDSWRKLYYHNRWNVLNVEEVDDPDLLTETTDKFIDTMKTVTSKLGVRNKRVMGTPCFPRKLKTLLKRRNIAAERLAKASLNGRDPSEATQKRFCNAQKKFAQAQTKWLSKQKDKQIGYTCRDIRGCDYKRVWARIKSVVGHDNGSDALQPVRDKDGKLCVTTESILEAIADHYDRLANENPGPSQDKEHWAHIDMGAPEAEMEELNDEITWPDVLLSIRRMNRNTSVNMRDGIHINVLKELLNEECMAEVRKRHPRMARPELIKFALSEKELPRQPHTPMGKAFFIILKLTWAQGKAPEMWNEVYICNLFKSGNPELLVNYRGISLISVGFKVLLGVMANRLYSAVDTRGLIVPEQAGFRRYEEAVAQYIAIAEIIRRRGIKEELTYAVFIDFKKAFDKVHHEALYRILEHMGVKGQFLTLIKSMYQNSKMSILAGGQNTRFFGMKRGNRQGCPLSPLLFIIFVNYLLKESSAGGVTVPGVPQPCQGGLYADDVIGLEGSCEAAKEFCEKIYKWGKKWGMELGLSKCGVMLLSGSPEEQAVHAEATYSCPDGELPKVTEYKYLGIEMEPTLPNDRDANGNEASFVKRQAAKGEKVLNTLRPMLRDPKWPLPVKAALIRTMLMTIMTYGAEWVGYKKLNSIPIQRVVNKAMKLAMGNSSKSTAHEAFTLSYELGLPTIEEEQNALRARLHAKLIYTTKIQTWLKILHKNPFKSLKKTWVTTNTRWEKQTLKGLIKYEGLPTRPWVQRGHTYEVHTRCNTYRSETLDDLRNARSEVDARGFGHDDPPTGVQYQPWGLVPIRYDPIRERFEQIIQTQDYQSKKIDEWIHISDIRDCSLERIMTANTSKAFMFYDRWGIGATRGYLRNSLSMPKLTEGIAWLVRIRTRAFPRIMDRWQNITRSGRTPNFRRDLCPLCGDRIEHGWEWEHLIMSCDSIKLEMARKLYLQKSIDILSDELIGCSKIDFCNNDAEIFGDRTNQSTLIPLNRAIAIYLIGGTVENYIDSTYHRGFGQTDELPEGLTYSGYIYIAQFLQEVATCYSEKIFPEGDPHYSNQDDFVSLYSPGVGSVSDTPKGWASTQGTPLTPGCNGSWEVEPIMGQSPTANANRELSPDDPL